MKKRFKQFVSWIGWGNWRYDFNWWWSNRRVRKFDRLFPLGSRVTAIESYAMLKVVYEGVRNINAFDVYVDEVRNHYLNHPTK